MRSRRLTSPLVCLLAAGCATIIKDNRNELLLANAGKDLRVYSLGAEVPLKELGQSDGGTRYKALVANTTREVVLKTEGLQLPVTVKTHVGVGWVVADLLLTGLIGLAVDGFSGRWDEFDDVNVGRAVAAARQQGVAVAAATSSQPPMRENPPEPVRQEPLAVNAVLRDRSDSPPISAGRRSDAVLSTGKLAVLDFKSYAKDFKPEDVRYFTDLVRGATLRASPQLEVMTRENLIVLLQATGKDLGQCEGECEVDTGRRIGADAVVSGEVLRVGSRYKMSLKLHETKNGRLISTAIASGRTIDELDESVQKAADDLLRPTR
jgi:hypothetical protein